MREPPSPERRNPLATRRGRLVTFFLLYLSEGLPLGLSIYALTAYFRLNDVSVEAIGAFMAAVLAPWSLKWLWAPFIDLIRVQRFGPNRFWIVLTQSMMAVTLVFLFILDPAEDLGLLTALLVVHNVFSSAQDVAIDGFAVRVIPPSELNWANGFMFGAQNLGMAIGGGGSLFLAGQFGFAAAFALVLGGLLLLLFGVSLRLQEPIEKEDAGVSRAGSWLAAVGENLKTFFRELFTGFFRSGIGPRVGVVFAVLPMGAMALAYGIASTLQVDLGFSEKQISATTTIVLMTGALGCCLAGPLADRIGGKRVLAGAYVLTALPALFLAYSIKSNGLESVTYARYLGCALSFQISYGLGFGVMGAVFMSLSNPAVGATQFTGYMSLRNVVISYSAYWQGLAIAAWGYEGMLTLDGIVAFLPIALIPFLRPSVMRKVATAPG